MSATGNTRKRPLPPPSKATPSPQLKHQTVVEEEEFDEDVILEETLPQYEEAEGSQHRALVDRLSKWRRPPIFDSYHSQSPNIGHSVCCNVHGFEPYFYKEADDTARLWEKFHL